MLPEEDGGEFRALETALIEELSPVGALQAVLAQRIAVAAWRLKRADRIEAEMLGHQQRGDGDLGLAVIRDGYGAGALATLLRYRGGALAEFTRLLRALKALQAEARSHGETSRGRRSGAAGDGPTRLRRSATRAARHTRRAAERTRALRDSWRARPTGRPRASGGAPRAPAPADVRPLPLQTPGGAARRELERMEGVAAGEVGPLILNT